MASNALGLVVGVPIGQMPLDITQRPSRVARRKAALTAPSESLRYIYPPPLAQRDHADESKLPQPPYPNARSYKRSVYYYWWAYLRENDEYLACCRAGGIGAYQDLYQSFGDVRGEDFWSWWCTGAYRLFHENDGMVELAAPHDDGAQSASDVVLKVPLALDVDTALAQVRVLLQRRRALSPPVPRSSTALFPVVGTPVLSALHKTLTVLRAKRAHPQLANYEIFDLAGLSGYGPPGSTSRGDRDDKTMEVSRRLAEARRLMAAAAEGRFPGSAAETRERRAAKTAATSNTKGHRASPPADAAASLTAYSVAPDLDITIDAARPFPATEWFQIGGNTRSSMRRWDRTMELRDKMREFISWTYRVRDEDREWRLPELDELIAPALARVLFLLPLSMCEIEAPPFFKVASLRNANPSTMALYRMAIYQNRLPLHWCFACSMFLYRGKGDEQEHGAGHRALEETHIAELMALLPHLRAVVLVGHDVQERWDKVTPSLGRGIQVWRSEEPTDALKQSRPDLWLTIPSRLPARHDGAG